MARRIERGRGDRGRVTASLRVGVVRPEHRRRRLCRDKREHLGAPQARLLARPRASTDSAPNLRPVSWLASRNRHPLPLPVVPHCRALLWVHRTAGTSLPGCGPHHLRVRDRHWRARRSRHAGSPVRRERPGSCPGPADSCDGTLFDPDLQSAGLLPLPSAACLPAGGRPGGHGIALRRLAQVICAVSASSFNPACRQAPPAAQTSRPVPRRRPCRPHRAIPWTNESRAGPPASCRPVPRRSPW